VREGSETSQRILKFVGPDGTPHLCAFGPFVFDTQQRLLTREGAAVSLAPKTSELLLLLVRSHGRLVEKEALIAALWPDSFVEESNLNQNVFVLRKALGEGTYIETVPRRGYLFTAEVREVEAAGRPARTSPGWRRLGLAAVALATIAIAAAVTTYRARTSNGDSSRAVTAREAYLKGRHHWNRRTGPDMRKAADYFRTAVENDPQSALAWAGLADTYNFLNEAERARVAAQRALEIDDRIAPAHAALANVSMFHDLDAAAGERHLQRALAIDPSYATAHQWYAFALASQGRFDEALGQIEKARVIDPASPIINTDVATILYYARRYDEAILQLRRTMDLAPDFVQARQMLGLAYARKGMFAEAAALRSTPDADLELRVLRGDGEAIRRLQELEKEPDSRVRGVSDYGMARAFAGAGDSARTVRSLERAFAAREGDVLLVAFDPAFDAVRSDRAFRSFLTRHRLGRV
jgi:DNA-binding winged helix-turn-helix (wHTH) protein/Tfp pilus assembly protein PilF